MKMWMILGVAACGAPGVQRPVTALAQLSLAADARMIEIPAGQYVAGSTVEERAAAYDDYLRTAGRDTARTEGWFEHEEERHLGKLPAFRIDLMPVTQAQYAEYVAAGKAPPPMIDEAAWKAQGFSQDYQTQVARDVWRDGKPPPGREDHPAVLVTWSEAQGYCAWRGMERGEARRLPTAAEYEKAARGDGGIAYPWGNTFEPDQLNSAVAGPGDTVPVGQYSANGGQYGMIGAAGNVFQWTSTAATDGKMIVKGSAWDDYAGVGRGASGHGRVKDARHVIIGFRCAADG